MTVNHHAHGNFCAGVFYARYGIWENLKSPGRNFYSTNLTIPHYLLALPFVLIPIGTGPLLTVLFVMRRAETTLSGLFADAFPPTLFVYRTVVFCVHYLHLSTWEIHKTVYAQVIEIEETFST